MGYASLASRLDEPAEPRTVTALPDGSVDTYYRVAGGDGRELDSTDAFGRAVAESGTGALSLSRTSRRPGGQAVNAARQARRLGDDVTLFGHLDHPVFAALDVEANSMGDPADVRALRFADDDVLLVEHSEDARTWDLDRLDAAADDRGAALSADAVCFGNWRSIPATNDVLRALGSGEKPGEGDGEESDGVFVLDPGAVAPVDDERVRGLFDALGVLDRRYDAVLSANRAELSAAADALGVDAIGVDSEREERGNRGIEATVRALAALRERADATAVVLHGKSAAVAATREGAFRLANLTAREAVGHTGPGDCFDAGLAHALARDWDWETALAFGNLAATYRVETDETGDRAELRAYLDEREPGG